jgi:aryl-alcohol dehydrogenase-like predicted oxidoreductase
MQYTQLGERGPRVSTIGFGAWAIGGMNWGPTDDAVSKRALHEALDQGVTLIDTADVYGFGHSENLIAEVIAERGKGDVIIATKAGNDFYHATDDDDQGYGAIRQNYARDYLIEAAERSLERLGVETVDILQLHSPDPDKLAPDDPWDALATLKRQGKIRHAGVSVQSFKDTPYTDIVEQHADLIDCVQVHYNMLNRVAEEALFPMTQRHGIGVIVRIPLMFGLLCGKFSRDTRFGEDDHRRMNLSPEKLDEYLTTVERLRPFFDRLPDQTMTQIALRYSITHPACHLAIPGAKTPEQVRENCSASDLGPILPELLPAELQPPAA